MLKAELKQQAEHCLGYRIDPTEWDRVKKYAERKLNTIIESEGDMGGARREPWYLVQIITETIRTNHFSQFTLELTTLYRYTEQMGLKKGQPVSKYTNRPKHRCNPIVSHII